MTDGQHFTVTMRSYLSVGPRTRNYRNGENVKARVLEVIETNRLYRGYFNAAQTAAFTPAGGAAYAWCKHIEGYRADPVLIAKLTALTPYKFIALLGDMIDAGVTNSGEGETYFRALRSRAAVAVA